MSARTKARKRALDMLYGADMREISLNSALAMEAARAVNEPDRAASWDYARQIVDGIAEHGDEIDELIETYAQGLDASTGCPCVDRAIVRIGIWEILFNDEVPDRRRDRRGRRSRQVAEHGRLRRIRERAAR